MKKILSLLTVVVLTSSSAASATAFTTNTNIKLSNIKTTKNLYGYENAQEHIQTLYTNLYSGTDRTNVIKMRYFITKGNILWANYQGWSHYFNNLYNHIAFWHPEVGVTAGMATWHGDENYTGFIFDTVALNVGNDDKYDFSVFSSDYWFWSSDKYDFMGDIDLDSHNGDEGGMHGTYVGTLLRIANSVPANKTGISFEVDFNLFNGIDLSFQIINTSTIKYW